MVRDRWEAEFTAQSIFISHGRWLLGLISTHIQKKKLCGQEINKWRSKLPIFLVPLWKEREAEITAESKMDERSKELLNIQGQDMWFTGFAKGRLDWSTQDLLNVHGQRMWMSPLIESYVFPEAGLGPHGMNQVWSQKVREFKI